MDIAVLLEHRLAGLPLLSDIGQTLQSLAAVDTAHLARCAHVVDAIPTVQRALGGDATVIAPFQAAWLLMYAAITRLDHLQDGDAIGEPLALVTSTATHYNLVLGCYVLATSLLDDLSPTIAPQRLHHLRRLWSDSMLRMAAGQQRDLLLTAEARRTVSLDDYQQIAQAKTGATFALAFGGTALLLSDDQPTIDALTLVGEIYGTLVQYSDDVRDAAQQPNHAGTLPQLVHTVPLPPAFADLGPVPFWAYLYATYRATVETVLAPLPSSVQQEVLDFFTRVFETNVSANTGV